MEELFKEGSLYAMRLHEEYQKEGLHNVLYKIKRVPGGRIYNFESSSVFVPFHNEYIALERKKRCPTTYGNNPNSLLYNS